MNILEFLRFLKSIEKHHNWISALIIVITLLFLPYVVMGVLGLVIITFGVSMSLALFVFLLFTVLSIPELIFSILKRKSLSKETMLGFGFIILTPLWFSLSVSRFIFIPFISVLYNQSLFLVTLKTMKKTGLNTSKWVENANEI